jgi:hypothetical protein
MSPADEVHVCTAVGCDSLVTVDLRAYRAEHPYLHRFVVCVDGRCRRTHWKRHLRGEAVNRVSVGGDGERSVSIKVVGYDARGRKRFRKVGTAFLRKVQPNGPECEPTCFFANVRVSRRGRLRQLDE